ncbi:MAG: hypothetical protein JWL59_2223 [Chthoniobacteraceae bacterium]|nr:hypothetical protein [Chthoniobacteraceae bacterium]
MAKTPTKVAAKTASIPTPAPASVKAPAKRVTGVKQPAPPLPVKPTSKAPASKKKPAVAAVVQPPAPEPVVRKAAAPRRKPIAAPAAPISFQEEVALRAYYLGEARRAKGLPGDEHHDWIEAERQIQSEAQPKAKTRNR